MERPIGSSNYSSVVFFNANIWAISLAVFFSWLQVGFVPQLRLPVAQFQSAVWHSTAGVVAAALYRHMRRCGPAVTKYEASAAVGAVAAWVLVWVLLPVLEIYVHPSRGAAFHRVLVHALPVLTGLSTGVAAYRPWVTGRVERDADTHLLAR